MKKSETSNIIHNDHIDNIIQIYENHPSILRIRENVNQIELLSFSKINERQMETEINSLNPKKAPGMDGIPTNILMESIELVKSPLTQLFNTCVETQQFPNNLKYAIVTPLFKKDDNTDKANYRPISVLPSISKIFERLMFKQISNLFKSKFPNISVVSEKDSPLNML